MKRSLLTAVFLLFLSVTGFAQDIDPQKVIDETRSFYNSMQSYSSDVTVTWDGEINGEPHHTVTSGVIKLLKPDLYNIRWFEKGGASMSGGRGVVWNSGAGHFMFTSYAYTQSPSAEANLSAATGVSAGIADTLPGAFFDLHKGFAAGLTDIKFTGKETVGGEECFVIEAASAHSPKITFWLSPRKFIVKKQHLLDMQDIDKMMPEYTDDQLKESLAAMGREATSENMEGLKKMMEFSKKTMMDTDMKATVTEVYENIVIDPPLEAAGLEYKAPAGTAVNNNAYDDLLKPEKIEELQKLHEEIKAIRGNSK